MLQESFIMNRIGDLGLLLGIFLIANQTNAVDYLSEVAQNASKFEIDGVVIMFITFLFVRSNGKICTDTFIYMASRCDGWSNTVSALIHAATMVTAGIYLVVRSNFLYHLAPSTLDFILYIGLATSLVLATFIGLRQNDIKKFLPTLPFHN